jgi:predicted nucleic acid-binding protein
LSQASSLKSKGLTGANTGLSVFQLRLMTVLSGGYSLVRRRGSLSLLNPNQPIACDVPGGRQYSQRANQSSPNLNVVKWLRNNEREIAVDPIILGELRFGILLLPKGKRRVRLERWFQAGVRRLECLPWDAETGLEWAALVARLRASGLAMPIKDSLIAATALGPRPGHRDA